MRLCDLGNVKRTPLGVQETEDASVLTSSGDHETMSLHVKDASTFSALRDQM